MKRLFTMFAAAISMWACQPADGPEDEALPDENVVPVANLGSSTQGLVLVDGNLVPQCSVQKSRCLNSVDYVQCAWSVENPGAEDWFNGGSCNSGYRCEQRGDEARCVNTDDPQGSDRSIRCEEIGSDKHLRVTVTGPILRGGLVQDPTRPIRLQYGADINSESNGWSVPYGSPYNLTTRRDWLNSDGEVGPFVLNLEPEVNQFNLYLVDGNNSARESWFRLSDDNWNVFGSCEVRQSDRGLVLARIGTGGGGGGGGTGGAGSIMCDATSTNVVVTIRGPILSRLVGSVTSPTQIQYGSNVPYQWDPARLNSNGRTTAAWTTDSATYTLRLPADANQLNFFLKGSNGGQWFNLNRVGGTVPWTVGGDCSVSGTLIFVSR